ncbi:MAG: LuxR C-terminal-related transcriptional regulator [Acidimicrobiia bacterium]|nr:LuxR C-terminal-related transcriptional regulator [Acidimicrobiia bacterium]
MADVETLKRVRALLDAIRERPTELPLGPVVELAERGVGVSIDRRGPEAVVYVTPRPDARFEALSPREFEVATLVAAGFSNAQIGEALFISVATVKDHVHAILTKTDLRSRSEVAAAWYSPL